MLSVYAQCGGGLHSAECQLVLYVLSFSCSCGGGATECLYAEAGIIQYFYIVMVTRCCVDCISMWRMVFIEELRIQPCHRIARDVSTTIWCTRLSGKRKRRSMLIITKMQSKTADFVPSAITWLTGWNIRIIFYSGTFAPLCENNVKLEVHSTLHFLRQRIEPQT